ncbi:MAG: polyphenol oxidase family protein [Clostridia bacterium]|nr:polyphenol oxidase family protein [Clostridia bacterium]
MGIEFFRIDDIDRSGIARTVFTPKEHPFGREGSTADRDALCAELGIAPGDMVFAREKHTSEVAEAIRADDGGVVIDGDYPQGFDALITRGKGILLCTLEADCVPVWLFDPETPAAAMIHSGWRGTAGEIVYKAAEKMNERFGTDPAKLKAFIGPHICGKCYEVGPELRPLFAPAFDSDTVCRGFLPEFPGTDSDRFLLNLDVFVRASLLRAGLKPENILSSDYCTYHSDIFNSYRKSGKTGKQMLTAVMLI